MAKEGSKKKIGSIIADVLVALVVIFAAVITIMVISSTQNETKTPSLFGYAVMNVESDSMVSEKGFSPGDLIIVKLLDDEEVDKLEIGDVVSYSMYDKETSSKIVNTHRIVEKNEYGGRMFYRTKGDNETFVDLDQASYRNILGKWTGAKISGLGTVFKFLRSQLGFFLCILLPIALFFLWQLYKLIVAINDNKKAKALEELSENEEEIKRKAIEEYLAKQKDNSSQGENDQE
ncbi:MAG: signal peptidase I [Clostridia bacterium]|nr:signal peptidase I [Clostridia bacterium]